MLAVVVLRNQTVEPIHPILVIIFLYRSSVFSVFLFFKCPKDPRNSCKSMFKLLRANTRQGHGRCTVLAHSLRKYIILCRAAQEMFRSFLFNIPQLSSSLAPKKNCPCCLLAWLGGFQASNWNQQNRQY